MMNSAATFEISKESRWRRFRHDHADLIRIYAILLLIIVIAAIVSDDFRTLQNALNVLRQAAALSIVSIGQTVAILTGGIDLSVGSTISMVAVYSAGLMDGRAGIAGYGPPVLIALLVATVVGLLNAFVITRLKVTPFIATLSIASIVQGVLLLYAKAPIGAVSPEWSFFAEGMIGPIPFPIIFVAILFGLIYLLLSRTVLGRYIFATGGDEHVARLSGIRTNGVIYFAYIFCAVMAGLTGLFLVSRMGVGDPQVGGLNFDRFDLDSIAAVLIGGTRLGGGKGHIIGTLAGVLIVAVLNNLFNLTGVSTFYQWIIKGLIILIAVAAYTLRQPRSY